MPVMPTKDHLTICGGRGPGGWDAAGGRVMPAGSWKAVPKAQVGLRTVELGVDGRAYMQTFAPIAGRIPFKSKKPPTHRLFIEELALDDLPPLEDLFSVWDKIIRRANHEVALLFGKLRDGSGRFLFYLPRQNVAGGGVKWRWTDEEAEDFMAKTRFLGTVHSHPGGGHPSPSSTDVGDWEEPDKSGFHLIVGAASGGFSVNVAQEGHVITRLAIGSLNTDQVRAASTEAPPTLLGKPAGVPIKDLFEKWTPRGQVKLAGKEGLILVGSGSRKVASKLTAAKEYVTLQEGDSLEVWAGEQGRIILVSDASKGVAPEEAEEFVGLVTNPLDVVNLAVGQDDGALSVYADLAEAWALPKRSTAKTAPVFGGGL